MNMKICFFVFFVLLLLSSCSKKNNKLKDFSSENDYSENNISDETDILNEVIIQESISEDYFGDKTYRYSGNLNINTFPDLKDYGAFVNIVIKNVNRIDLDNLYYCDTKKLTFYEDSFDKFELNKDCPQIKEVHIQSCDLNKKDLFVNFSNIEYIFFSNTKIGIIPDLSKNIQLKEIIFDTENEYNENLDLINNLRNLYPKVKISCFTGLDVL